MIKISCIITTRNRIELLQRAVKSVLEQTYKAKELIIVDDASDDGTKEWCEQLIDSSEEDVKYIRIPKEESKGGNYARNLGIKESCGKYIAFLDDDDRWMKDKLEWQSKILEANPDCVLVYGNRIIENIDINGKESYKQFPLNEEYQGDVSSKILTAIFTTTSLIMVRRDRLFAIGLFDEKLDFWQEYELSIRLAQKGTFLYVDKPLIYYRVNTFDTNRLTNKYYEWRKAVKYVRNKHKNLYKKLSLFEALQARALIWEDAKHRTKTCGLNGRSDYFAAIYKLYRITLSLKEGSFFRKLFNRKNNVL